MLHFSISTFWYSILYNKEQEKIICSRDNGNDLTIHILVYQMEVIMENVNLIVAENLKRIRVNKGWSQAFVARQLGVAQRTISRCECGCGVSERTLKKLCSLYGVTIASLYNEYEQEQSRGTQIVPDEVAVGLLIRNSFIQDLEKEVILRYTDIIQKEALLMREDVEQIIPEALSCKKTYSLSEVVTVCMAVNQKTLSIVREIVS